VVDQPNGIAIGLTAGARHSNTIAIGYGANVTATNSIAFGFEASSSLTDSLVLGTRNVIKINNITGSDLGIAATPTPVEGVFLYSVTGSLFLKNAAGTETQLG